ncbi:unnamed protein product [Withania somnifera]
MRAKFPLMAEMFGPKRRTGTSEINMFQFMALHRPSNGPWTKRPLPERTMSRGPPPLLHKKDKQTHSVDCGATSPTTRERDSLKNQGRGWPRGPTWRLGISAGNAKVAISRPAKENQLV